MLEDISKQNSAVLPQSLSVQGGGQSPLPIISNPLPHLSTNSEDPTTGYHDDFLDENDAKSTLSFLNDCRARGMFKSKNGRETLAFGVGCRWSSIYNESKDVKQMPEELEPLLKKAQSACTKGSDHKLNLVLINYYPKKDNASDPPSTMPAHSDDEPEIAPGSEIATYSLGATRTITFSSIHDTKSVNLEVEDNSLYTMTRRSQVFYKHAMHDVDSTDYRYSLTMRCVDTAHLRSTLIVGDSNTNEIQFGEGRGKLGEKYPGKKLKASQISNINPGDCVEYKNVVIVCGTNDLRPKYKPNVPKLFELLKSKITEICMLNPKATVFIMPVLPTRTVQMNKFITAFNVAVLNWVRKSTFSIVMPDVRSFLDSSGLLATIFAKSGDPIHLNNRGLSKFVGIMKGALFENFAFLRQQVTQKTRRAGARAPEP